MPVDNLLLNVFIILLAILGLFAWSHIAKEKYFHAMLSLLPSAAVLLCMTFPFTLFPGQIYDLRLVIILLGILYGGIGSGIAVTGTSFVYRYLMGGAGFMQMVITFTPVIAVAFFISHRFLSYSKWKKLFVSASLNAAPVLLNILIVELRYPVKQVHLRFLSEWGAIEIFTTILIVFLIETVRSNIDMARHLQELEKKQLLHSLTASIAHEIRNPLTVSRGFLQLLKENDSEKAQTEYLDIVLAELDRAAYVIDDYLSLSAPHMSNMKEANVSEIMQQGLTSITPYATLHNVQVIESFERDIYASIDVDKFLKSMLNIVKNGIEAMPTGGTLSVKVHQRRRTVVISVNDTGVGMTTEEIQQLGNPFYSTKHKGTGLGLMTSYRFIQLMNGQIQVTSKVNGGTTFTISLPLADSRPSVLSSPPAEVAGENLR